MTPAALAAWLSLASRAEVTAATLAPLLAEHGDIEAVAAALGGSHSSAADGCDAVRRWLDQPGSAVVTSADPAYPPALRELRDAPILLYVLGDTDLLSMPALAIVGSRKPTAGGRATAHDFACEFAVNGLCIVSGLALGIDAAAHRGALAGDGATVAVLGTGIDRVYPAANRELAQDIAARGAIISEFPLGTEPRRSRFPRRNRLISGLALGTLVVEAAEHSGSLITARLAGDQGREVFAIPGSIHNPMVRGCHRLIRDGARLVESAADVFAELPLPATAAVAAAAPAEPPAPPPDPEYVKLLDALGWEPVDAATVALRTGLTIGEVSSMLLILELDGVVEVLPGGRYARLGQERQDS